MICVAEHALSDQAPELINALGEPTAAWDERLRLIEQFDVAERKTRDICRRLLEFELFEPFDADFHPNGKQATKLVGLARINKARIDTLEAAALKELVVDGTMRLVDAHLLSLQRFDRILNLAAAR